MRVGSRLRGWCQQTVLNYLRVEVDVFRCSCRMSTMLTGGRSILFDVLRDPDFIRRASDELPECHKELPVEQAVENEVQGERQHLKDVYHHQECRVAIGRQTAWTED